MTKRTHHCGELRTSDVGKEVTLCGWLQFSRMDGQFIVIKDAHGVTQVTVPEPKVLAVLTGQRRVCICKCS